MVILFSGRKCKTEKEIIEILLKYGATYISDKKISEVKGKFTIISEYKKTDIKMKNGIAVILDDTDRFNNQTFPNGIVGICEDSNKKALELFEKSNIPVISCGMNSKNTITLSSLNSSTLLATLQRTVKDKKGNEVTPGEFKIKLSKDYNSFSVMSATAILLLNSIKPNEF